MIENTLKTRNKTVDALIEIKGKIIGIEINSIDYPGLRTRNMAYITNIYSSYTEKGNEYTDDELILQINFIYQMMKKREKEEIDNKEIREYYMTDEEGITERNIEIAKNLIFIGLSDEDIIKSTGISKEELKQIKNKMKKD